MHLFTTVEGPFKSRAPGHCRALTSRSYTTAKDGSVKFFDVYALQLINGLVLLPQTNIFLQILHCLAILMMERAKYTVT